MMLPVGEYDVRIERTTGGPLTQKVKIEENKTVIIK
jgi:hypothetical protein